MAVSSFLSFINPLPVADDLDDFSCAICLEIFEKPHEISCGHTFCKDCLSRFNNLPEPTCPKCRQIFNISTAKSAYEMEMAMDNCRGVCSLCSKKVKLTQLRNHIASCEKKQENQSRPEFAPVAATSQPIPQNIPNRHTFTCPYCGRGNLDIRSLVSHCNEEHSRSRSRVVCPICASMPWGNPRQKSANLLAHLNLRHRFEYDTLVDFEVSEDEALKNALATSLTEK